MTDASNTAPAASAPSNRAERIRKAAMIVAAVAVLLFVGLWFVNRNLENTDDAFIESNVVLISPRVGGFVTHVAVVDNQWVKAGDLLAEIDPRDYDIKVKEAEANLAASEARHGATRQDLAVTTTVSRATIGQASNALDSARALEEQSQALSNAAEAQAQLTAADVARYQALFDKDEISHQRLDQAIAAQRAAAAQWDAAKRAIVSAGAQVKQAQAKLDEARSGPRQVALKEAQAAGGLASVAQARAALEQAKLDLFHTRLVAPVEGRVTRKALDLGQLVQSGPAVMAIVYGDPWVLANFKETQLRRMHVGQPVDITVDAFPDHSFKGHVDSIQSGTGSRFSLLPAENATGNYVKVVQRVPVKIVFDEKPETIRALVPGMSVEPKVNLSVAPK